MALQTVGQFQLNQQAGYVCHTYFQYMDPDTGQMNNSGKTGDELLGQKYTIDPGSLGVPNGATVWIALDVVLGKNTQAQQGFIYQSGNSNTADYTCSGAVWSPSLALNGVSN